MYHRRCSLPCEVLSVIASGKSGTPRDTVVPVEKIGDPKRYFRTFGEKEYASIRLAIVACDD